MEFCLLKSIPISSRIASYRTVGIVVTWAGFLVMQVYSLVSGVGYLSLKSPQDAIDAPFLSIMALLMVLMAPLMVVTMVVVHAYAAPKHKVYSMIALIFMIILAGITSSVNFGVLLVSNLADVASAP